MDGSNNMFELMCDLQYKNLDCTKEVMGKNAAKVVVSKYDKKSWFHCSWKLTIFWTLLVATIISQVVGFVIYYIFDVLALVEEPSEALLVFN